ncbi:MAG: phosphoglycerate mutase family protein, partial [Acidimicrobiales bacterium]
SRSGWHGPDLQRTLSKKGERQAAGLAALLNGAAISAIHSSPAVRCLDTVAPMATTKGVNVHETEALLEGAEPKAAMHLLRDQVGALGDTVLCAHGDLIPEVLRRLAKDGTKLHGGDRWAKGSMWELEVNDGAVVSGRYHPPPEAR